MIDQFHFLENKNKNKKTKKKENEKRKKGNCRRTSSEWLGVSSLSSVEPLICSDSQHVRWKDGSRPAVYVGRIDDGAIVDDDAGPPVGWPVSSAADGLAGRPERRARPEDTPDRVAACPKKKKTQKKTKKKRPLVTKNR